MRKGRVNMGTAVRQFECVNKKYLRQGALVQRVFLLERVGLGPTDFPSRLREGLGEGICLQCFRTRLRLAPPPTPPACGIGVGLVSMPFPVCGSRVCYSLNAPARLQEGVILRNVAYPDPKAVWGVSQSPN